MYEFIPSELKRLRNWVCWKAEPDPRSHSGISKKPINPRTGGQAQSNNPETWSDFDTAVMASENFAGIGFMFGGSGYFGVDLDGCENELYDYSAGRQDNIIGEFINTLHSYAELSQSKKGIHIICKGSLPPGGRRRGNVEMYDSGRFFVMTGDYCSEFIDVTECTEKIKPLHAKYLGSEPLSKNVESIQQNIPVSMDIQTIIEKAKASQNGDKFSKLFGGDYSDYGSQSEADMAFCNLLAFWCGGDADKMDSIYRSSGLMREKWDRRQSGSTYGKLTIAKAIKQCDSFYGQNNGQNKKSEFYSGISIGGSAGSEPPAPLKKYYSLDDTGNAQRLHDAFGDGLRYSYVDKKWLYYKDGKWNYDNIGYHRAVADASVELIERERINYRKAHKLRWSNRWSQNSVFYYICGKPHRRYGNSCG